MTLRFAMQAVLVGTIWFALGTFAQGQGQLLHVLEEEYRQTEITNHDDILEVQVRLYSLGLDPGPLDGQLGPRTLAAVGQFYELYFGIVASGRLRYLVLEALRREPAPEIWGAIAWGNNIGVGTATGYTNRLDAENAAIGQLPGGQGEFGVFAFLNEVCVAVDFLTAPTEYGYFLEIGTSTQDAVDNAAQACAERQSQVRGVCEFVTVVCADGTHQ